MNHFATNLTYCRKVFRVTQENLAIQLGRSQSTIGGWENKVSEPNVDALIKISEFFGISIDNIIKVDLVNVNLTEFKEMVKKEGNVNLMYTQLYTLYVKSCVIILLLKIKFRW